METRFATYFISTSIGFRIAPAENCERRVLIVSQGVVYVSAAQSTIEPTGLPLPGTGYAVRFREPVAFILRANQALYAFAGDGGGASIGVVISEHPMGCMP